MNYKSYITIGFTVFLLMLDRYALQDYSSIAADKKDNIDAIQVAQPLPDITVPLTSPTYAHLEDRLKAMHKRRPEQRFDPAAVAAAVKRTVAWEAATSIPKNLDLKPGEFTDGRQFIQFDILKLESLMPGDAFQVNIIEVRPGYDVVIDRVEKNNYSNVSWFGHIDGNDGQTYDVSFTRGKQLIIGGMDTPEGHYVLQVQGTEGWIASSKLIFKTNPAKK